jgi:hypothetical protein
MNKVVKSLVVASILACGVLSSQAAFALPIGQQSGHGPNITKKQKGGADCAEWCIVHNKTQGSLQKCLDACDRYWG